MGLIYYITLFLKCLHLCFALSAEFGGEHTVFILKRRRKSALAVVPRFLCHQQNAFIRAFKQCRRFFQTVLFYMGRNGISVDLLEYLFKGSGVYVEFFGKSFYGYTLRKMLRKVFVNFVYYLPAGSACSNISCRSLLAAVSAAR